MLDVTFNISVLIYHGYNRWHDEFWSIFIANFSYFIPNSIKNISWRCFLKFCFWEKQICQTYIWYLIFLPSIKLPIFGLKKQNITSAVTVTIVRASNWNSQSLISVTAELENLHFILTLLMNSIFLCTKILRSIWS